jgi:hypothetical protein
MNSEHIFGTIADAMNSARTHRRGKHSNILEKYNTYKIIKGILRLKDRNTNCILYSRQYR